jgi:hypothetical protein
MKELDLRTSDMNVLMEVLPRGEIVEENVVLVAFVRAHWENRASLRESAFLALKRMLFYEGLSLGG